MAKVTYKKWLAQVKHQVDAAMMEAICLKEDLEAEVDKMDQVAAKRKVLKEMPKRYYNLVSAVDQLDMIVGHLVEAGEIEVRL